MAEKLILNGKDPESAELREEMRSRAEKLFARIAGLGLPAEPQNNSKDEKTVKPADMGELIKLLNLETQYVERLDTLWRFGFLAESGDTKKGDIAPPDFEKVLAGFKPEELEIAKNYQKPVLLLVPENSFSAKVAAIDSHRVHNQSATYLDPVYGNTDSGSEKITGYRAWVVDGAQEMGLYKGDDVGLELADRIRNRKSARKPYEKGIDRHIFIMLMMESIKNGEPIDQESYTLLDDDFALSADCIPAGVWERNGHAVSFGWVSHDGISPDVRLRSSVGGDVLIV